MSIGAGAVVLARTFRPRACPAPLLVLLFEPLFRCPLECCECRHRGSQHLLWGIMYLDSVLHGGIVGQVGGYKDSSDAMLPSIDSG